MTSFEKLLPRTAAAKQIRPIALISKDGVKTALNHLTPAQRTWVEGVGFSGETGQSCLIPDDGGRIADVWCGVGGGLTNAGPFAVAKLASTLPEGVYALPNVPASDGELIATGWLLEAYRFTRYREAKRPAARLVCPRGVDRRQVLSTAGAVALTRDLINTPTADMGPDELETACRQLAAGAKARVKTITGARLKKDFAMIEAVGRASASPPRLIDMTWGPAKAPKVTLVGKGVCFDTGGLDLKPSRAMLLMKKDMGGAANVLGLAAMIMDARLKVRLRVLIPAVENAVAGNAFRPGDVLTSRKGLTVEVGNTDAEGRLVLADALALADAESPDLLIDMATLTGAARVALGPDLPAFFTDDDTFASELAAGGQACVDPVWRMPLWRPYGAMLDSKVADLNNVGGGGFAGAITAALFLTRFVENATTYVHFDVYGWNPAAKPAKPFGGEAHAIRALFHVLKARYG